VTPEQWKEVKEALAGALERPPGERAAYLDRACTGPLLRREVESLLAEYENGDSTFLEPPAIGDEGLKTGATLGPYQIAAVIGAGGMGVVYRARDTRLNRTVAIKVLPDHLADKPDLRERFEREARAVASLNHSHICTLYDIGHQDGVDYLVMEYLEGETLAQRLVKGPLPLDQVLQYAIEIADALDKAQRKGVTHRDLKPANIVLTKSGTKLLDFGLAKLTQAAYPAGTSLSQLPAADKAITAQGTILGTLQYMAPEQLEGKEADARTDIFAFGLVVYEMATGKKAFDGNSQASLIGKILETDPPSISAFQPMTPPALDRAVKKCLAKEPDRRWQAASDLRDELKWIAEGSSQIGVPAAAEGMRRDWLAWGLAAVLGVVAGALGIIHFTAKPLAPPPTVRLQIRLPDKVAITQSGTLVLSPDQHRVAFPANGPDGVPHIWIQELDAEEEARVLSGTDIGPQTPPTFWSPDSRFVVFSGTTKIEKADVFSGAIRSICDKPGPMIGGSWSREGVIIFGSNTTGLWRVPAQGGTAVPLTALDASRQEGEHEQPQFLPDGKHFLYLRASSAAGESGMYVGSLDDAPDRQSKRRVLATQFGATFVPSDDGKAGRLLFLHDGTLMAQRFDPNKFELLGEASPIAERVGSAYETAEFSASSNILVYREETPNREYLLTWFDDQGRDIGTVGEPGEFVNPQLSPDGTRVVFSRRSPTGYDSDLWMLDLARGTTMRFTFGPGSNVVPVWSPDGSEIVFASNRDGSFNLYRKPTDGSIAEKLLLRTNQDKAPTSWSRDGQFLLYDSVQPAGNHLWLLPMRGEPKPTSITTTSFSETAAEFSPDGRWIAYSSNETGQYEVYIREFTGSADSAATGRRWIVSKDGGAAPRWRADGKELVYSVTGRLMSVPVDVSHSFQAGTPHPLFQLPPDRGTSPYGLTVTQTADLKRFLLPAAVERRGPQSFTVMVSWASMLKP